MASRWIATRRIALAGGPSQEPGAVRHVPAPRPGDALTRAGASA